jgi:hypothetical protein
MHPIITRSPLIFLLSDNSGAHTTLTVSIEGRPPISHSFDVDEGQLRADVKLSPGHYRCAFTVQVFKHGALNGMYDCSLKINGHVAGRAKGNIEGNQDVGSELFELTVNA